MLAAVKGIIQGNTVVIEDEDMREYDGAEVIVTLLEYPAAKKKKTPVDWDSFVIPSERGKHVPQYFEKMKSFFAESYDRDVAFNTSVITVEEYFVFPYRNNMQCYIDMFEKLIRTLGVNIVSIDGEIAKKAAKIRAEYKAFKSMDALQLMICKRN